MEVPSVFNRDEKTFAEVIPSHMRHVAEVIAEIEGRRCIAVKNKEGHIIGCSLSR